MVALDTLGNDSALAALAAAPVVVHSCLVKAVPSAPSARLESSRANPVGIYAVRQVAID